MRGVDAEPRGGFTRAGARDASLEAFCAALWQRHEARSRRPSLPPWPHRYTFHTNWPELAEDLIVASWKIAGAEGLQETAVIDVALLDPPEPPALDWHDTYALELKRSPLVALDLASGTPGDGVELVLEQAQLKPGERAVMRAWLYNPDLALVASDLGWRPQTVIILYRNAIFRLQGLRWGVPTSRRPAATALARHHDAHRGDSGTGSVSRARPDRRGAGFAGAEQRAG